MKLRQTLASSLLIACLWPAADAFSRGGETGTLDDVPIQQIDCPEGQTLPINGRWEPYYLRIDRFQHLRMRLADPNAVYVSVPGWDGQTAWKFNGRYFTQDGVYELLPLLTDTIR